MDTTGIRIAAGYGRISINADPAPSPQPAPAAMPDTIVNTLLRSMDAESFAELLPWFEPVDLPLRYVIAEANRDCQWMVFPDSGIASRVARCGQATQEIGVFGREGAGSMSIILGARHATFGIVMQVPGRGHRISATLIRDAAERNATLRHHLLRYVHTLYVQISQSALANAQAKIEQRLARWLLMVHDRLAGDEIDLTHEFLSTMLGVGRTGVTIALHALGEQGLIRTSRKRITIANRTGLVAMTKDIYGVAEAEYLALIGPTIPPGTPAPRPLP